MIPDYQSLMLPVLQTLKDGTDHKKQELIEVLAAQFGLTSDELAQKLPSGVGTLYSRISWAIAYMKAARLLEAPKNGVFRITPRGLRALSQNPASLNVAYLSQFPEFLAFKAKAPAVAKKPEFETKTSTDVTALTPEESLLQAHREITAALASDLLDRVKKSSPVFFERLVLDLLIKLGYGGGDFSAAQVTSRSGDEGIDGTIKEDALGLDQVFVQAKRYATGSVGRPAVQGFGGALLGQQATKGVFITTSAFSEDAKQFVKKIDRKVSLIDGEELVRLMIRTGVGVTTTETLELKRIDSDYFEEE